MKVERVFQKSDQELKGASNVQNGLDSSGNHRDGSPAELGEVRTDVQSCERGQKSGIFTVYPVIRSSPLVSALLTVLSISVNSPDASGDKHGDASSMSRYHGGGHRRSSGKALRDHRNVFEPRLVAETADFEAACGSVTLCWARRADPGGTPSRSSCTERGAPAPPMSGRRGPRPRSPPPWLGWLLLFSRWLPPPLQFCTQNTNDTATPEPQLTLIHWQYRSDGSLNKVTASRGSL